MGLLLLIVGLGWAAIGAADIVWMFVGTSSSTTLATFGLMLNTVLFVLPGLAVGALGEMLRRRGQAAAGSRMPCRRCGESIPTAATRCRFCDELLMDGVR